MIYYEYGALVLDYTTSEKATRVFNILKDAMFDDKQLLVLLLPNIQVSVSSSSLRKHANFCVTFSSRIFDFRIISESLNSLTSTRAVYKAYCNSLVVRNLFSRSKEFANFSEN